MICQWLIKVSQSSWFATGTQKRKLDVWGLICSLQHTWSRCAHLCYREFKNQYDIESKFESNYVDKSYGNREVLTKYIHMYMMRIFPAESRGQTTHFVHRESDWLVEWSKTRYQATYSLLPTTRFPLSSPGRILQTQTLRSQPQPHNLNLSHAAPATTSQSPSCAQNLHQMHLALCARWRVCPLTL